MTPQEHARTYPFLNGSRLTPQDEAWVAAHMYRTVIAERIRHRKAENVDRAKANPGRAAAPYQKTHQGRNAIIEKGRAKREQILKIIGTGAMSVREVHQRIPRAMRGTEGSLADTMRRMKRDGILVNEVRKSGTLGIGYWSRTGKEME